MWTLSKAERFSYGYGVSEDRPGPEKYNPQPARVGERSGGPQRGRWLTLLAVVGSLSVVPYAECTSAVECVCGVSYVCAVNLGVSSVTSSAAALCMRRDPRSG